MRKIREILRLKFEAKLSERHIVRSVGAARSTVQDCLVRARAAGVSWPLPADWDDVQLERVLYPPKPPEPAPQLLDFAAIRRARQQKGVTLLLLWQEYKEQHPDGLQYSAYCERYARWRE